MRASIFLVYNKDGIVKTPKTLKGVDQGPGLFVQRVNLHVPDEVFERAIPDVTIQVPAEHAQPVEATVSYDDPGICTTTPAEVIDKVAAHEWMDVYRCPDCGAQKEAKEPFGIHYKPTDEDEGDDGGDQDG